MNWKVLRVNARCIYSHCTMHTPAVLEQQKTWQNWNVNIKSTSNNTERFSQNTKFRKFYVILTVFVHKVLFSLFFVVVVEISLDKKDHVSVEFWKIWFRIGTFSMMSCLLCVFFVLLSFDSQISKIKHKTEPYMQINWTFAYEFICT